VIQIIQWQVVNGSVKMYTEFELYCSKPMPWYVATSASWWDLVSSTVYLQIFYRTQ